ncbi:valine--tRNA ligase [Candidatus Uhrbacteria bacterium]|nr:valine--tRNA ligase [Candidatus Uhrbacteria bacterium]
MPSPQLPSDMPKAYDPAQVEDAVYQAWLDSGYFSPDNLPGERAESFCTVFPPPNVTGVLHLGHALENALMDAMARYQRLRGKKVLLVPGTDHAALPTQAKVEKLLIKEGMENPRKELGREGLVAKIREFAEQSRSTILNQVQKMGTSCDWSRLAYTFDDQRNVAVKELFCRMYADGLIYRGYRVVNWSVKGQSTSSDDEIEYVERPAKLYTFKYGPDFPITIASTRPETKLGDTAVAVHPADVRYQSYIGKTFTVDVGALKPLEIKIIADEGVDPAFGTGALGVTPAHSPIDFAMYEKQKAKSDPIALIPVIGQDGRMTEAAGPAYAGLTTEEAREKFVVWLSAHSLLEKEEEIVQNVGTSDRYGDVIEAIPMTQWWLDVTKVIPSRGKSLRDLMREAVTTGLDGDPAKKVTITPDRFTKMYLERVENLRDWCLSRQIWWGHRIPAWYHGDEMRVGVEAPEGEGWEQDPDTLDTWFSSGSWTFSTLGWPNQTQDLKEFHPTTWIQMGYEILYLWLMRMILMSAYALEEVPFKDAYIHGILRDQHGKKFSKSSGNGIDPIEVINQYGCDALRLSVMMSISPGNDSRYYTEKIESGRNLVNKMWNISRFVLTSVEDVKRVEQAEAKTLADRWILSRFSGVTEKVTMLFERYDFSLATEVLRDFTWNEFADWYLEIAKIQRANPDLQKNTDAILLFVLERLLVLWHPFMPFVTEEVWKRFGADLPLIVQPWPETSTLVRPDAEAEAAFETVQQLVTAVRNLRAEYKVEPSREVSLIVQTNSPALVEEQAEIIRHLARVGSLEVRTEGEKLPDAASAVVGGMQVYLPLAGLVDAIKERQRLEKELESAATYVSSLEAKLANAEFVSKAPASVVDDMRRKREEAAAKAAALAEQLKNL